MGRANLAEMEAGMSKQAPAGVGVSVRVGVGGRCVGLGAGMAVGDGVAVAGVEVGKPVRVGRGEGVEAGTQAARITPAASSPVIFEERDLPATIDVILTSV